VTDEWRPTSWPTPIPWQLRRALSVKKPTKNARENEIVQSLQGKFAGQKDWQILQKTFDKMK